jgi:hypothetical protein
MSRKQKLRGVILYSLNLGDFSDRTLMNAVNQVAPNSVMLFEDIDCMKTAKTRPFQRQAPTVVDRPAVRRKTLLIATESLFLGC